MWLRAQRTARNVMLLLLGFPLTRWTWSRCGASLALKDLTVPGVHHGEDCGMGLMSGSGACRRMSTTLRVLLGPRGWGSKLGVTCALRPHARVCCVSVSRGY